MQKEREKKKKRMKRFLRTLMVDFTRRVWAWINSPNQEWTLGIVDHRVQLGDLWKSLIPLYDLDTLHNKKNWAFETKVG